MRNIFLLLLLSIVFLCSSGCGGTQIASNQSNVNTSNVNATPAAANAVNETLTPPANAANANANMPPPTVIKPKASGTPGGQTAPDNSVVTVSLTKDLVQTRTFKGHPTLLKIEETSPDGDATRKTIKVFLKGGQIKELSPDKIGDPMAEPAAKILAALGMK